MFLKIFLIAWIFVSAVVVYGQGKFYTKTGSISFHSETNVEDIDAHNRSVTCVLDSKTGNVQFAVLMKGFEFKKALMQEHFNESYVESDKYPKAEFKGHVINNSNLDYTKTGVYPTKVKGQLAIHGQTKELETAGTVTIKGGKVYITSEFQVLIADYNISVPSLVKDNVSKTISVKVSCELHPLE